MLIVALAAVACDREDTTAPPSNEVVDVFTSGDVFLPFSTFIGRGGTVRFNITRGSDNDGHNVIFDKPAPPGTPEDIPVVLDSVVSRRFNTVGTFKYDCLVHPGMSGEIVVENTTG
jgi:plastocyanin